jgi:hypothetical protein
LSRWMASPAIWLPKSKSIAGPSPAATPIPCRCTSIPTSWRCPPAAWSWPGWRRWPEG